MNSSPADSRWSLRKTMEKGLSKDGLVPEQDRVGNTQKLFLLMEQWWKGNYYLTFYIQQR